MKSVTRADGVMHLQGRKYFLDARPRRLQPWRQHKGFAEMRRILVDREARSIGRELEQHTAGFLEVDRLEPEAIDDRCRMVSRRFDARSHLVLVFLVVYSPREVMH